MTHDERWDKKYLAYMNYIEKNHRCPSKHHIEDSALYSWWKHNRKLMNAGKMRDDRKKEFQKLIAMAEANRHVNQFI